MPAPATGGVLSGSTDGLPIIVTGTATGSSVTVHTAVTGVLAFDALYIFASNVTALPATLTLEWGAVTDPGGHLIKAYPIPANSGPIPIAVGQRLNNAKVVKAFSGTGSAINLTGWYNRIYI